jgi:hypothetical protein
MIEELQQTLIRDLIYLLKEIVVVVVVAYFIKNP